MTTELKVVFDWKTPVKMSDTTKERLEAVLVKTHNLFSEEINKHLVEWNESFDSQNGDDYDSYMHKKYDDTLQWMIENNQTFKEIITSKRLLAHYGFYIGKEFELHLTLTLESIFNDYVYDVSFHLERA